MGLRPHRGIVLTVLDNRGVLFSELDQQLYLLDALAAAVWHDLWVEGVSCDAVIMRLSASTGCSREQIEGYIASCLEQWEAAGFIRPPEPPELRAWTQSPAAPAFEANANATESFRLAGVRIFVSFPDETIAGAIRDVFGHLRAFDEAPADFTFMISRASGGYRLLGPNGADRLLPDPAAVIVWLKIELLESLLIQQPDSFAIHAAGLRSPAGVVLLTGSSGSGKSTLAAILNARGWPLVADDVVLIRNGCSAVSGLPLAYAAKPGSWPILQKFFPGMEELQVHLRPDGRTVKYIPPRAVVHPEKIPVTAIVFPRYEPSMSFEVRPFDRVEALVRLLEEARNARHHLSIEGFLTLSAMVGRSSVLELSYDNASEAANMLIDSPATLQLIESELTSGQD
ncbi:hypothetical protein DC522_22655 [Microvirga sp. KLBC 81]|nr:hypothetical protein DC522_22655 [Microvirga sp. KLBC 81]